MKPLDSVARNVLLVLRNKRTALDADGKKVDAINWMASMLFNPEKASKLKSFLVDHDGLLGLMGRKLSVDGKYYSFNDLEPHFEQIHKGAIEAGEKEQEMRDSYDQNVIDLYRSIQLYRKVKHTLVLSTPVTDSEMLGNLELSNIFYDPKIDADQTSEFIRFRELTGSLAANPDSIRMGSNEFAKVVYMLDHYSRSNIWSEFFPIPPELGDENKKWRKIGESMVGEEPMDSIEKRNLDPARFSAILRDLVQSDPEILKQQIVQLQASNKLDPSVLFATQYAEAIKLRRGVDPVLKLYEELRLAYSEQNDPEVQRDAFVKQVGEETQELDDDFLTALEHGMPPAGGMGMGIDRLVIFLTNAANIRDTILFPTLRPN